MRRGHAIRMLPGRWARCWGVGCDLRAATTTVSARGTSRSTSTALRVWWVPPVLSSVRCASSGGIDSRPSSDSGSVSNAPPCMDACQTLLPFERDHREPGIGGNRKYEVDFDTPKPFEMILEAFHTLRIAPEDTPAYLKEKNLTKEEQLKVIKDNAAALMQQMAMAYRGVTYEHINARLKKGTASDAKVSDIAGAVEACEKLLDNTMVLNQLKLEWFNAFQVYLYRPLPPFEDSRPLGAAVEPSIGGVDRRPSSDSGSDAAKDVSRTPFPFELDFSKPGVCGERFQVYFRTTEPFETMLKAFRDLQIQHEDTPDFLKEKNLTVEAQMKDIEENAAALMQQMAMAYRGVTYNHINARLKRGTASDAKVTNIAGSVKACEKLRELGCGDELGDNISIIYSVKRHKVFHVYMYRPLPPVEQPKSWSVAVESDGVKLSTQDANRSVVCVRCSGKSCWDLEKQGTWLAHVCESNTLFIPEDHLASWLHVFSGESGSGKTVTALATALATMSSHAKGCLTTGVQEPTCVRILVNGMRDEYIGVNDATSSDDRNENVKEYLTKLCKWIERKLNVAELQTSDTVNVTLVFDECGPAKHFRRGLCALYGRHKTCPSVDELLTKKLPEVLKCTNVYLMAAGTGSELVTDAVGSLPDSFEIHRVDCHEGLINGVHASLIKYVEAAATKAAATKATENVAPPVFSGNLKSLARFLRHAVDCVKKANDGIEELTHPVAMHIGRLMRNLRIASLFVNECVTLENHPVRLVPVEWREVAPEFMRRALSQFKTANGLRFLTNEELQQILFDALGHALGGPEQELSGEDKELLFKYGLLTDNAKLVATVIGTKSDESTSKDEGPNAKKATPVSETNSPSKKDTATVPSTTAEETKTSKEEQKKKIAATDHVIKNTEDGKYAIVLPKEYSTRYRMSTAVAEIALRGFGNIARSSDSLGFEDTMRDFVMMHMMGAFSGVAEISIVSPKESKPDAGDSTVPAHIRPWKKEISYCNGELWYCGDPLGHLKECIHQQVRAAYRDAVAACPDLRVHFASLELSEPKATGSSKPVTKAPAEVLPILLRELKKNPGLTQLGAPDELRPVLLMCAVKNYPKASAADVFAASALIKRGADGNWQRFGKNVGTNVRVAIQCKHKPISAKGLDYRDVEREFGKMPNPSECESFVVAITNVNNTKQEKQQNGTDGVAQTKIVNEDWLQRTIAVKKGAIGRWLAPVPIMVPSERRNPWNHASELSYSPVSVKSWKVADPKPAARPSTPLRRPV